MSSPYILVIMLEIFADDNLAALWDLHYPYRVNGETAEQTITNLGAYVKHIHIKESESLSELKVILILHFYVT